MRGLFNWRGPPRCDVVSTGLKTSWGAMALPPAHPAGLEETLRPSRELAILKQHGGQDQPLGLPWYSSGYDQACCSSTSSSTQNAVSMPDGPERGLLDLAGTVLSACVGRGGVGGRGSRQHAGDERLADHDRVFPIGCKFGRGLVRNRLYLRCSGSFGCPAAMCSL